MTERRGRPDYYRENIDPEISEWCDATLAKYPGVYKSKRALLHDLLRRGQISWLRESLSSGPAPQSVPREATAPAAPQAPTAEPAGPGATEETATGNSRPRRQGRERKAPRPRGPPATPEPTVGPEETQGKAGPEIQASAGGGVSEPAHGAAAAEPPASSEPKPPAPTFSPGSAWTCPDCHETMPKEQKGWHGPDCPGKKPTVTVERTIARRRGPASGGPPPSETVKPAAGPDPAIIEYVRGKLDGARLDAKMRERLEGNPTAWLVGMVQLGARSRGLPEPFDAEAQEWIRTTLAREIPAVGKLLAQETAAGAASPRPPAFEIPRVKCGRCGKLIETTAAAREDHFKECPPDPPKDEDRLVESIRARILGPSSAGTGTAAFDADLERDLQVASVRELAEREGVKIDAATAGRLLERARAGASTARGGI